MASDAKLSLRKDLARELGADSVVDSEQVGPYCHDAAIQRGLRGVPDAVVRPADAAGVARALRWCYRHDCSVVPRGGGTGLVGGAVAVDGGVVVSVERLNAVRGVYPELGRMYVQAAVSTANVSRLARESGLMFPPDPGAAAQSQIGGNVATNAGGPHAFKYGPTRRWVSGLEVALAPGELAVLGSDARKDASGYDLVGLLAGSEGTLGIVTAVQLRLAPAPATVSPGVVFCSTAAAQGLLSDVLGSGLQLAVLDFIDAPAFALARGSYPGAEVPRGEDNGTDDGFAFLVELDGSATAVAEQRSELAAIVGAHGAHLDGDFDQAQLWRWRDGLNGVIAGIRGGKVSEDICVPAERLLEALAGVQAIGSELGLEACAWGHAGDGIVHATYLVDTADGEEVDRALDAGRRALSLALALGGSITGEHGVGVVKRDLLGANWDAATLAAHGHVKAALDPKGLLNPGKKEPLGGWNAPQLQPQPAHRIDGRSC
jgi:FAD/FMN-containing dehydrogenase